MHITRLILASTVPQVKGFGLRKGFVLVLLAAMKRKFENPKCLVEFL